MEACMPAKEDKMRRTILSSALSGLLLFGCRQGSAPDTAPTPSANGAAGPSSRNSSGDSAGPIELDTITLTPPAGWERKPPSSQFVVAELVLTRAAGDDADGRLTISTAGGSVEANIDRWKGQFDPQPKEMSQEEVEIAGLKVTIVDFAGEFNDQRGPFAPAALRRDYRMIAAVIPADGQLHFVKATGPKTTIAAHADEINQFIRSLRRR
jgi:hypothetical protein